VPPPRKKPGKRKLYTKNENASDKFCTNNNHKEEKRINKEYLQQTIFKIPASPSSF
jgi:hypothetical protein